MAIIYDLNNALKPPILNNISNINAPLGQELFISSQVLIELTSPDIALNSTNVLNITSPEIQLNGLVGFSNPLKLQELTTVEILALSALNGMVVFCSTINQVVFYQVSPITGLVLGWYNSTGTIKL